MTEIIQKRKHDQVIHFKGKVKRTLFNVVKVYEDAWTHIILEDGREFIVNPENVLFVEVKWHEF